jgi:hypothetical protein
MSLRLYGNEKSEKGQMESLQMWTTETQFSAGRNLVRFGEKEK